MKNPRITAVCICLLVCLAIGCAGLPKAQKNAGSGSFNGDSYALDCQIMKDIMRVKIWAPKPAGPRVVRELDSRDTTILVLSPNEKVSRQDVEVMFIDQKKASAAKDDHSYRERSYVLGQDCFGELSKFFEVVREDSPENAYQLSTGKR